MITKIENEADHQAALERIEAIFNAKPGTPEGDEFEALADLINDYEDIHYPMGQSQCAATPVAS